MPWFSKALINLLNNSFYEVNRRWKKEGAGFEPWIGMTTARDNNFVNIIIEDNGDGVDPGIKDKIFDITQKVSTQGTNKEIGTGLGLLLCKELIEKHDGEIWVESEVGKGSNFKFTIPIDKEN